MAVLLCLQPALWVAPVARAQTMQRQTLQSLQSSQSSSPLTTPLPEDLTTPGPDGLSDVEVMEGGRGLIAVDPALKVPLEEPLDPDKYVCGRGDVFELNFWGVQNFKERVTVDVEGRAFVPKVGYLTLEGKTLRQARKILRESVARYFPRLDFDVTLVELRTFLVHVVATVGKAGVYTARPIDRVSAVVHKAGGVGEGGSLRRIEVRRRDGTVLHADLLLYRLTGESRYNPQLLDGDIVQVPVEDVMVSVSGAVHRPGRYELVGSKDLTELLDLAGGLSPSATTLVPMRLTRRMPDDRQKLELVAFDASGRPPNRALQADDVVSVPYYTDLQLSVMVIGAVAGARAPVERAAAVSTDIGGASGTTRTDETSSTRRLPFVEGDTVRTLIERVGGVSSLADLSNSFLLRGGEPIPVNLNALLMLRDLSADRPVQIGDTLVIPFQRSTVMVEGAVFSPGEYPFNPRFGIAEYLASAGGPNRFAQSMADSRVQLPNGESRPYAPDMTIPPGASIVVPDRSFSRAEVVQIIFGVAGILLSGVAVVVAASK